MRSPRLAAVAAAALALVLSACSTGATGDGDSGADGASSADASAFPVTIKHAHGETTVATAPTRVATLGWSDQDAVLSLGVVPVASTKITYGGNAAGSTEWFDAKLTELGGTAPVRYRDADGIPVEEVA